MKSLRESIENSVNEAVKPVEFDYNNFKGFSHDSTEFGKIQSYCEEIFNAYVENFGDKVPSSPDSKGMMRMSPFEKAVKELVDTSNLSVYACKFIRYYVYSRLEGIDTDEAMAKARTMYNASVPGSSRMR